MENDDRNQSPDASEAQAALDGVTATQNSVANRTPHPWWYHAGLGASIAVGFASIDIGGSLVPSGLIAGFLFGPALLTYAVSKASGVSVSNPMGTPSARGIYGGYLLLLGLLFGLGMVLKIGVELTGAMTGAGLLALVLTVAASRRADTALVGDVRSGA